jgi:hypothetical protein
MGDNSTIQSVNLKHSNYNQESSYASIDNSAMNKFNK